ncbi:MAG: right-handed parallel beta-helix repeat-containing protein [Phycisphaerales bacterium]|nr:right-handed parallel beta-helix repeat-containing protein [Phycisphaerales bacterium]
MLAPNTNSLARIALTLLAAGGVISTLVWAGPLKPPGGAVSSTYKTLTEVEPRIAINSTNTPGDADSLFKITQPGSYYLTGNITGVVGKHGIEIAASGVTLDLNGFDLVGSTAFAGYDGVMTSVAGLTNITIRNGSVRDWGGDAVDVGSHLAKNCSIENVRASNNAGIGIQAGLACTMTNCSATQNAGKGFFTSQSSHLVNCTALLNGDYGIRAGENSTLSDCSAKDNSLGGFLTDTGSALANCSAISNDTYGFTVGSSATLSNCSAYSNASTGFNTDYGCTLSNCTAFGNTGSGVFALSGCTLSNCAATGNGLNGLNVGSDSCVTDCSAYYNPSDGILCSSSCLLRGNSCTGNGNGSGNGANIHATGADNRVEGNNCIGADRGIDVDTAGNIIIKNTCSGNTTNWDVVAGNTILVVQGSAAGAVLGNTGGTAPGSTDPNANFTY